MNKGGIKKYKMAWDKRLGQYDIRTKLLDHMESFLTLKKGGRPFPVSAEIHVTNNCNHRCNFCEARHFLRENRQQLKTDLVKIIIRDLKEHGIKGIVWSGGGEPLVHSDFFEILDFSFSKRIDNGLITNFSIIKPENIPPLIDQLSWIRISFNGGNRETYHKIHGINHFDKVIENIKILSEENIIKGNKLPISISMVYTKDNFDSILDLVNTAILLNIHSLHIRPDQFITDLKWLKSDKVRDKLKAAAELPKNMESSLQLSTSEYMEKQYLKKYPQTCYAHFFTLSITADGYVNFCKSRFDRTETDYGNCNTSSINDIWYGDKVKKIEKMIKPCECAGFCRQMHVNVYVDDIITIPEELMTNFI